MISEIIKKEKEKQEGLLFALRDALRGGTSGDIYPGQQINFHTKALINLKKYLSTIRNSIISYPTCKVIMKGELITIREDIMELTKMIEAYTKQQSNEGDKQ